MVEAKTMEESLRRLMDVLADHYEAVHIQIFLQKDNGFGYECACRRDEPDLPPASRIWNAIWKDGWTSTIRRGQKHRRVP